MEQSHNFNRKKIKPRTRESADRAVNFLIPNSERQREKTFDVGRIGAELDKKPGQNMFMQAGQLIKFCVSGL